MSKPKADEPRHFDFIDALRGWAFIAVVFTHCGGLIISSLSPRLATMTSQGARGVGLFFVISAFTLMSSSHARERKEHHPTRNFLLRRFFRIAPLFWSGALFYSIFGGRDVYQWSPDGIGLLHYLLTLSFLHGLYPTTFNAIVPGGWSIAVEMMFYLCVPFLVKALTSTLRTLWAVLLTLIGSLVIGAGANAIIAPHWQGKWTFIYNFYFSNWIVVQLPVFLIGFLLFFVIRATQPLQCKCTQTQKRGYSLALLCVSGYLLLDATFTSGGKFIPDTIRFAAAHFLLAWSLSLVPWRILVNPVMRYLGTISFSGYICHFAIVFYILPTLLSRVLSGLPSSLQLGILFVFTVAATAAVGSLTYRFIELPGIAMGRSLIKRLEKKDTEALPLAA